VLREDRAPATRPNDVWAMDFVHDQLATGRKIQVLTVVDTFSRFSPAVDPRFSYRAENVVATLERVCAKLGYPKTIRVDQGSEFVSRDLDLWAYAKGVTLGFSRRGKPSDNAFIEAFNGRFRSECLNTHWFLTLADAAEPKVREANRWRLGSDIITRIGRTGPSATSHRSCCRIPAERPAYRRDRRPETPASGAPANGLGSVSNGLHSNLEENQGLRSKIKAKSTR